MIKLIVTDMDGSLLNDKKQLPHDFEEVLQQLFSRGVHFAIASGRTYLTLMSHFEHYQDKMQFICDNGATVYKNGKCVYKSLVKREDWLRIALACQNRKGVAAVVNGLNGNYLLPYKHDVALAKIIEGGFGSLCVVEDMSKIDDEIYKIGVCDSSGPENGLYNEISAICGDSLDAVLSGPVYMDVMGKNINKGSAVRHLQRELGIDAASSMGFGDYFNDAQMLKSVDHSFMMANAHPGLKQFANFVAPSNQECGVTETIKEYIKLGKI